MKLSKPEWWDFSYLWDWISSFLLLIVVVSVTENLDPFERFIPGLSGVDGVPSASKVADVSSFLAYPNEPSLVPYYAVCLLSFVPILLISVGFSFQSQPRSFHDVHNVALTLLTGFTITLCLTEIIKIYAGRHRPNFLERCQLNEQGGCSGDDRLVRDAKQSFPSGHSSTIFWGMTTLFLYLCGKLKLYSEQTKFQFPKLVLAYIPILGACFIGVSRTRDFHHNFDDVLAGAVLGIFASLSTYFLYFPSLSSKDSHFALSRSDIYHQRFGVEEPSSKI